ncbi:amino acid ABC transporter permease [Microtetraspora malaysiensis]|uniref:amino acid ABC transporter permease n=1 Tax=Microtetraspora malaysiensis TaxID=161358 RepID=UPI003D8F3E18
MTRPESLHDELGPAARRRVRLVTGVAVVALAVATAVVVLRLREQGQFAPEKWSPLFNPFDPTFSTAWRFLLGGLSNTAMAGLLAIVLSLVIGTLLAITRVTAGRAFGWIVTALMETFRAVPVVISIFFVSRFLPIIGVDLPLLWYLIIGLTLYNSIAIAEIVRAGILAVPRGQSEAAAALGLSGAATMRLIVLPQALRVMLPALISQMVIVVKDTALGFIIGFEELLRRGEIAVQTLGNPLQMYLLIAAMFIAVNYSLSRLAELVERRLSAAEKP